MSVIVVPRQTSRIQDNSLARAASPRRALGRSRSHEINNPLAAITPRRGDSARGSRRARIAGFAASQNLILSRRDRAAGVLRCSRHARPARPVATPRAPRSVRLNSIVERRSAAGVARAARRRRRSHEARPASSRWRPPSDGPADSRQLSATRSTRWKRCGGAFRLASLDASAPRRVTDSGPVPRTLARIFDRSSRRKACKGSGSARLSTSSPRHGGALASIPTRGPQPLPLCFHEERRRRKDRRRLCFARGERTPRRRGFACRAKKYALKIRRPILPQVLPRWASACATKSTFRSRIARSSCAL